LKILHVTTFFEPELGYEEFHTAKEQAKDGHEVHVICTNLRSDRNLRGQNKYLPAKKEIISNINVHRLRCLPELKAEFVIPIGFNNTLRNISPDIIHAHTATQFTSWLAVRFSKKRKFPVMVDIHGLGWQKKEYLNLFEKFKFRINKIFDYFIKYTIHNANKLIIKASPFEKELRRKYNVNKNKMILNEVGFDSDIFFKDEKVRSKTRTEYGISKSEKILIIFGFLRKHKRLDIILDVLEKLPIQFKLFIAGSLDNETQNNENITKKMEALSGRIIRINHFPQKKLNELLNASDVTVWPANVSVGLLQASAVGIPSIYPDWGYEIYPISKTTIHLSETQDLLEKIFYIFSSKTIYNIEQIKAIKYAETRSYAKKARELIDIYNTN